MQQQSSASVPHLIQVVELMKEIWTSVLDVIGLAWWVEIKTEAPRCTYYFGPFLTGKEAEAAKSGYIEDLEQEGAQDIKVVVKRCKPNDLTIFDEFAELNSRNATPVFSGQM